MVYVLTSGALTRTLGEANFSHFTENFRFFGSHYFLVTKKIYQNFKISFEYVPEYVSFQIFLDTERELDLVQSQVFLEVEKNPFSYHNLLTLNFNTDLGSKWALNDGLFN